VAARESRAAQEALKQSRSREEQGQQEPAFLEQGELGDFRSVPPGFLASLYAQFDAGPTARQQETLPEAEFEGTPDASESQRELAVGTVTEGELRRETASAQTARNSTGHCSGVGGLGFSAPDFRTLPADAWAVLHGRFLPLPEEKEFFVRAAEPARTSEVPSTGDFRTLPADAWAVLHGRFSEAVLKPELQKPVLVAQEQQGQEPFLEPVQKEEGVFSEKSAELAPPLFTDSSGDFRTLPADAWAVLHGRFSEAVLKPELQKPVPVAEEQQGQEPVLEPVQQEEVVFSEKSAELAAFSENSAELAPLFTDSSGDFRTLPAAAWAVLHGRFAGAGAGGAGRSSMLPQAAAGSEPFA
ncbi:unnamed protein product, partial [Polarella glacialis]